jgi:environmental stress-induced protein Ves
MPWKNGKGVTREVASEPLPGAPTGRFLWRISLATVEGESVFSPFPGIDRTIAVLAGDGMQLTVDGVKQPEMRALANPFPFSGDSEVSARCLAGPITDLNVMTSRGHAWHRVQRYAFDDSIVLGSVKTLSAIVFAGACTVRVNGIELAAEEQDVLCSIAANVNVHLTAEQGSIIYFIEMELLP